MNKNLKIFLIIFALILVSALAFTRLKSRGSQAPKPSPFSSNVLTPANPSSAQLENQSPSQSKTSTNSEAAKEQPEPTKAPPFSQESIPLPELPEVKGFDFQSTASLPIEVKPTQTYAVHPYLKIRIVKKPQSEEPDWVNQAWIGLEIPVVAGQYQQKGGQEVISGKYREYDNYIVPLELALSILKEKNPEAEKWWRENAKIQGQYAIGFDVDACQLIGEAK